MSGDFITAIENWKQYFNTTENEVVLGEEFANAAVQAFKANNLELAISWFDQARYKSFSSAEMYETLAEIYKQQNNLSKELSALEFYSENINMQSLKVNNRLFSIYSEIGLNEKAQESWNKLDEKSQSEENNLLKYFLLNKKLEKNSVCDSVSLVLLEKNKEQIDALEWNAKKYYWAGQNRYNEEMEKYNKNKTTSQYKRLLTELELVTTDFKKSLPYLQTLWKINPGEEYAGYLANIYARFGDEKKANFYKQYHQ
jgi:tetratricopeptide (TPR) repeat protein